MFGGLIAKGRFMVAWSKFGLDLRRLLMNLRDMGDKQGGRTWWAIVLAFIYLTLVAVEKNFGAVLPLSIGGFLKDWLPVMAGALGSIGVTAKVMRALKGIGQ